jgi:hypothetical protein
MIWLNIRQIDAPQRSARSTPKPMIRRVKTSITTMIQWLHKSIDSQRNRSTLHRLSFICPIKLSQDGAIGSCVGSIVLRKHPADDVFVDIDAKGTHNLLCDAGTANTGIVALELDDRVDEFLRRPFGARASMTFRREKPPIFALPERCVEPQQGSGLQDDGEFRDPVCWNEQ